MDRVETGPPLPALPSEPAAAPGLPRPRRRRGRRLLVLAVLVLVPAVLLRGCVLDTFVIRSGSMEPAFTGADVDGDHLLVLRAGIDPRPIARWDAVVVDGSVDPELPAPFGALLKRVVGLPGERVALRGGDVWTASDPHAPLELVRKPDKLIARLLVPVHEGAGLLPPWRWDGPGSTSELEGGGVRLVGGEPGGQASYAAAVEDGLLGEPGEHAVADTALQLDVGACDAVVELRLREGADVFRARLAPAARGGAALYRNLDGRVVATSTSFAGLRPGDRVLMWNVDDGVRVLVNGVTVLAWDQPTHDPTADDGASRNDPSLLVEGGSLELRRVVVLRDLHYGADGNWGSADGRPVLSGRIFLLGDNSRRSRDSRWFGPVPVEAVLGRPFAVYAPWARAGWLDRRGCRP